MGDIRFPMDEVELYVAPDATTFSNALITAAPTSPWVLLGNANHRDGVTISRTQSLNHIRVENAVHPKDIRRSEATLTIGTSLVDLYAETLAYAVHGNTSGIVTVAATTSVIGTKQVFLDDDQELPSVAFLARSGTPYPNGTHAVCYLPRCKVISDFETTLMLADTGVVPFMVEYVEHPTLRPHWTMQTDPVI